MRLAVLLPIFALTGCSEAFNVVLRHSNGLTIVFEQDKFLGGSKPFAACLWRVQIYRHGVEDQRVVDVKEKDMNCRYFASLPLRDALKHGYSLAGNPNIQRGCYFAKVNAGGGQETSKTICF